MPPPEIMKDGARFKEFMGKFDVRPAKIIKAYFLEESKIKDLVSGS